MGFNTTVVVLNDALDEIERDPKFGKNLVQAILECGCTGKPVNVSSMNHGNAAKVIESHHADYDVLIKVGGNRGEVIRPNESMEDLKERIRILEDENKKKDEKIKELSYIISEEIEDNQD